MNTTVVQAARVGTSLARTVLGIFKLRIGVLIMISALAGLAITPGPAIGIWPGFVLALSVLVASASAGAFNQYIEADSDRLMARTRNRAFATGALAPSPLWLSVIGLLLAAAVGATALVVNPLAALFIFLGAFFYGVVYTVWLKRRTWANIVVGGLSGSFAVLAGAAAVDPALGALPLLLALVLFLWTPPMLPVVVGVPRAARIVHANAIALVAVSLLPVCFGAGPVVLAGALLGGAFFLRKTRALAHAPSRATAMASFFASMVQLSALLAAVAVDAALR
jgi:protoheme IX farnesyltransferase